mmetsp:Transcript_68588/g.155140  ORF Transcript_68588/g.155140 Transcript_68588/m.155140 type:complete len:280 (+) Transcript_68588:14-853(+)
MRMNFLSYIYPGRYQAKQLLKYREEYETSQGLSPLLQAWVDHHRPSGPSAHAGGDKTEPDAPTTVLDASVLGPEEAATAAWLALGAGFQHNVAATSHSLETLYQRAGKGGAKKNPLTMEEFSRFLELAGIKGASKKQVKNIMAAAKTSRSGEITFAEISRAAKPTKSNLFSRKLKLLTSVAEEPLLPTEDNLKKDKKDVLKVKGRGSSIKIKAGEKRLAKGSSGNRTPPRTEGQSDGSGDEDPISFVPSTLAGVYSGGGDVALDLDSSLINRAGKGSRL